MKSTRSHFQQFIRFGMDELRATFSLPTDGRKYALNRTRHARHRSKYPGRVRPITSLGGVLKLANFLPHRSTRFSYVAASLISIPLVLQWQAIYVSLARKAAKVEYPLGACSQEHMAL